MTGAILQARLSSKRLPNKVLRRIGRRTILEHCLHAMKRIAVDQRILATDPRSYGILSRYILPQDDIKIAIGPECDVLSRFSRAAHACGLNTIMRLTADNPFVSVECANLALREFVSARCDYFHYVDLPLGAGVEIFTARALHVANRYATTDYDREHVTPYIYRNSSRFAVARATRFPYDYSSMRITVDTERDYQRMVRLFSDCNTPHPSVRDILAVYQRSNG